MSASKELLRQVLENIEASIAEKINAAKALDAIERKDAAQGEDAVIGMTIGEIEDEIRRTKALIKS